MYLIMATSITIRISYQPHLSINHTYSHTGVEQVYLKWWGLGIVRSSRALACGKNFGFATPTFGVWRIQIASVYTQNFNTAMHTKFQTNSKCAFVLCYMVIRWLCKINSAWQPLTTFIKNKWCGGGAMPPCSEKWWGYSPTSPTGLHRLCRPWSYHVLLQLRMLDLNWCICTCR